MKKMIFLALTAGLALFSMASDNLVFSGKSYPLSRKGSKKLVISSQSLSSVSKVVRKRADSFSAVVEKDELKKLNEEEIKYQSDAFVLGGAEVYLMNRLFLPCSEDQCEKYLPEDAFKVIKSYDWKKPVTLVELTQVNDSAQVLAQMNKVLENPEVEWCNPDLLAPKAKRLVPNDPLYAQQWHLASANANGNVDAPTAWDSTTGDSSLIISIIDDGIDTSHPEFSGKIVDGRDVINNDNDASHVTADDGHGTSCAGVAAAAGNNSIGVAGLAYSCKIMPIYLVSTSMTSADEIEAFEWAASHGAAIQSNSWGPTDSLWEAQPQPDVVRQAIHNAVTTGRGGKGCVFFWAAGNGDESTDLDGYASNPEVINVGATAYDGTKSYYSDFGETLDLCAPSSGAGQSIVTTDRTGSDGYDTGDYTYTFGGTSSATPLAAGAGALVLSVNPNLSWKAVKAILQRSCDQVNSATALYNSHGFTPWHGYGKINAASALTLTNAADSAAPSPVSDLAFVAESTKAYLTWTASGDDGTSGQALYYDLRYSSSPISDANFDSATPYYEIFLPLTAGSQEKLLLKDLDRSQTYYFALKVYDKKDQGSTISNAVSGTIPAAGQEMLLYSYDFEDSAQGWNSSTGWERVANIGNSNSYGWTDSPSGDYANAARTYLFSPDYNFTGYQQIRVEFDEKHEFEVYNGLNYDFGYFEVSPDAGSGWYPPQDAFTSTQSSYRTVSYYMPYADENASTRFRFRIYADDYEDSSFDGLYVDNVKIYGVPMAGINVAPSLSNFSQSPLKPEPGQTVDITVTAADSDNIAAMNIFISVGSGAFQQYAMTRTYGDAASGVYSYQIPAYPLDSVVKYYLFAQDGSTESKSSYYPVGAPTSTMSYTVAVAPSVLDIGGYYVIEGYSSGDKTITIPSGASVSEGGTYIICRNSSLSDFNTQFGVAMTEDQFTTESNLIVNGSATGFSLYNSQGTLVDQTYSMSDFAGNTLQRTAFDNDGNLESYWNKTVRASASPGSVEATAMNAGVKISEIADADDYNSEYIELYYDKKNIVNTFSQNWQLF